MMVEHLRAQPRKTWKQKALIRGFDAYEADMLERFSGQLEARRLPNK